MDQAISIMGMPGIAKLVEFNPVSVCGRGEACLFVCVRWVAPSAHHPPRSPPPFDSIRPGPARPRARRLQVRASDVLLPPGCVFVVANSLAVSNKAESATKHYNLRVVECRLASGVLALALGESKVGPRAVVRVRVPEAAPREAAHPCEWCRRAEPSLCPASAGMCILSLLPLCCLPMSRSRPAASRRSRRWSRSSLPSTGVVLPPPARCCPACRHSSVGTHAAARDTAGRPAASLPHTFA